MAEILPPDAEARDFTPNTPDQGLSLRFPLLSDFEPKGAVAKRFGAYRQEDGVAERALFVLAETGVVAWSCCSPIAVNPGADGMLDAHDRTAAPNSRPNCREEEKSHGSAEGAGLGA